MILSSTFIFNACVMSEHLALERKNIIKHDALIGTWMVEKTPNSDKKDSIIISKINGTDIAQYLLEMTQKDTKEIYKFYVGKIKKTPTFVVSVSAVDGEGKMIYVYGVYSLEKNRLKVNFLVNMEGAVGNEPNKEANEFKTLKEIQEYLSKNINNKAHYKETITFIRK
jgi:hypothetical protein